MLRKIPRELNLANDTSTVQEPCPAVLNYAGEAPAGTPEADATPPPDPDPDPDPDPVPVPAPARTEKIDQVLALLRREALVDQFVRCLLPTCSAAASRLCTAFAGDARTWLVRTER